MLAQIDMDAFYCHVEAQSDPTLAGTPFVVGGHPDTRGVVASASYQARQYHIHAAMPTAQALRLCPHLRIVAPHFAVYRATSQRLMRLLADFSPHVMQLSIDEAVVDISMMAHPLPAIAHQLQTLIQAELGLPCSIGIGSNRTIAKMAATAGKKAVTTGDAPRSIYIVEHGQEAPFLAPLPVGHLIGVGPRIEQRLRSLGITTIGELARRPTADLTQRFGTYGQELSQRAHGVDDRPVAPAGPAKQHSHETTFPQDVTAATTLTATLKHQAIALSRELQRQHVAGTTIKLKLRHQDFTTLTRQTTLAHPTNDADTITMTAIRLFEQIWQPGTAIRLIGIGVSSLQAPLTQLDLWDPSALARQEQQRQLYDTIAALRARFGEAAIRWGSELPAVDES